MNKIRYYLYENVGTQFFFVLALTLVAQVCRHNHWVDLTRFLTPDKGEEGTLYGTLTTVLSTLLGFALAAGGTIFSSISSSALGIVRQSETAGTIGRIFSRAIFTLSCATLFSYLLLIKDFRDFCDGALPMLMLFLIITVVVQILACGWLLKSVIELVIIALR